MPTKARRGYRMLTVEIPSRDYDDLTRLAEASYRSIEAQGGYMLASIVRLTVEKAEDRAVNEAAERGNGRLIGDAVETELEPELEEVTAAE